MNLRVILRAYTHMVVAIQKLRGAFCNRKARIENVSQSSENICLAAHHDHLKQYACVKFQVNTT